MAALLCAISVVSALATGICAFQLLCALRSSASARAGRGRAAEQLGLSCAGMAKAVIGRAREESVRLEAGAGTQALSRGVFQARSGWMERGIRLAGLEGQASAAGLCALRAKLTFGGGAIGFLAGAVLSNELAVLMGAAGCVGGATAVRRAFKEEARCRTRELERCLPEMLEVVSLGLRSGLSFERSFELYHRHFEGRLADSAARAHRRWSMGLATREQALRDMAREYESKLLNRLVENVVRSLRFGSSLTEGFDALAAEARDVRKARLQEAIAKAPVKMMVPTGTLILPAMLLLVLGPVLLELMHGF